MDRSPVSRAARWAACWTLALVPLLLGCSAFIVLFRPGVRDLSVLEPGTPRWAVIQELGRPVRSVDPTKCPEDLVFPEGYSPGEKAWRIPVTLVLDVFTFGMAEARLFEHELERGTPRVGILVRYDAERRVESACVYQGGGVLGHREGAPFACPAWMLLQVSECGEEQADEEGEQDEPASSHSPPQDGPPRDSPSADPMRPRG